MQISRQRWLLIALSAALQIIVFPVAGPLPIWRAALVWIALAPMLVALLRDDYLRVRDAAVLGYGCGILWYLGTCYWVYSTMHIYGGLSVGMGVLTMLLFCLYLGLYHALFATLLVYVRNRLGCRIALAAVPAVWVAVEWARWQITGFPWNLLGYSQVDNLLLTQLAPVAGVCAMSFVIAGVNALLAMPYVRHGKRERQFVIAAVVFIVLIQAGVFIAPDVPAKKEGTETAVAMQPNLPAGPNAPRDPFDDAYRASMHFTMTEQPRTVTLWPEAPTDFIADDPLLRQGWTLLASRTNAPLIANAVHLEPQGQHMAAYNSAVMIDAREGYVGRYDKMHLVPFGEYVPFAQIFSFADGLTQQVGNFKPGKERSLFHTEGRAYGIFICYESIFGDEVRQLARDGAQVLINLSDDGWYGDTSAPFQHMNMARMRAIENRRWVVRDTNNGITAAIDPYGRMIDSAPRHQRLGATLHFDFESEQTIYTRFGDWFAWLCAALTLVLVILSAVIKGKSASPVK